MQSVEDKELLEALGSNIRMLRSMQGYSQEAFARHIGIDRSYMGCIERGERNLAALNLIKIARGLNIAVGKLFKGIK